MTTRTSSSAYFYTSSVVKARKLFFGSHKATDNTTEMLVKSASRRLDRCKNGKMLDIGTGNGFVLTEVCKTLKKVGDKELFGIDLSEHMVDEAKERSKKYKQIEILWGDNHVLPFDDNYFDVVTNKLVTNFSFSEVFRVLKKGGIFIFKEYGLLKGFGGITEMFEDRIKTVDPLYYLEQLRKKNLQSFSYTQYYFEKTYSREDIISVFSMAPIIKDFNVNKDMLKIDDLFVNGKIDVVSDPFLMIAKK